MSRLWPGGTAVYLESAQVGTWNFNTNVCLMAILKTTSFAGGSKTLIQAGVNGNRGFELDVGNTGYPVFVKVAVAVMNGTGTTTMVINEWYALLAFSTTGGNASFKLYRYSNSTLTSETITNTSAMNIPSTDRCVVGNVTSHGTVESWLGDIDRAYVGQGTLPSNAEFTAWARAGTIPPSLTTKGYWILGNSPETDLSGNANDLTVTGTSVSTAFVLPDALPVFSQAFGAVGAP